MVSAYPEWPNTKSAGARCGHRGTFAAGGIETSSGVLQSKAVTPYVSTIPSLDPLATKSPEEAGVLTSHCREQYSHQAKSCLPLARRGALLRICLAGLPRSLQRRGGREPVNGAPRDSSSVITPVATGLRTPILRHLRALPCALCAIGASASGVVPDPVWPLLRHRRSPAGSGTRMLPSLSIGRLRGPDWPARLRTRLND